MGCGKTTTTSKQPFWSNFPSKLPSHSTLHALSPHHGPRRPATVPQLQQPARRPHSPDGSGQLYQGNASCSGDLHHTGHNSGFHKASHLIGIEDPAAPHEWLWHKQVAAEGEPGQPPHDGGPTHLEPQTGLSSAAPRAPFHACNASLPRGEEGAGVAKVCSPDQNHPLLAFETTHPSPQPTLRQPSSQPKKSPSKHQTTPRPHQTTPS